MGFSCNFITDVSVDKEVPRCLLEVTRIRSPYPVTDYEDLDLIQPDGGCGLRVLLFFKLNEPY